MWGKRLESLAGNRKHLIALWHAKKFCLVLWERRAVWRVQRIADTEFQNFICRHFIVEPAPNLESLLHCDCAQHVQAERRAGNACLNLGPKLIFKPGDPCLYLWHRIPPPQVFV